MYFLNPGISLWELPNRMYCHLPILILGCTSPLTLWIPSVIVDVQPNTVNMILNSFWSHRMATKIWISRLAYEDLIELGQNFLFLNKSIWFSAKLNQCWHYRDGGMLNLTTTASPFASALWLVRSGEAGAVRARLVGRSKLDPPYNSHPITHSPRVRGVGGIRDSENSPVWVSVAIAVLKHARMGENGTGPVRFGFWLFEIWIWL